MRFRDIAAFVLHHATFSHPTSRLPKFPNVPLVVGGWPFGYEERRCWANCPCNWFPRFPTYVILIHQRHRRTDDMRSQDGALHYSASRTKKPCQTGKFLAHVNLYTFLDRVTGV